MNYELYFMALSGGLYLGSHLGGLVHFGGKQYRLGGFDSFWREVISFLWRVRSILAGSVLRNSLYVGIQ